MPETRGISKNAPQGVRPQELLYGSLGGKKESEIESVNASSVGPGLLPVRFRESQGFIILYLTTVHGCKFIHIILDYFQEALFREHSWPFPNFFWAKATVPCERQMQGWGVCFPVQIDIPGPSLGNPSTEAGTIEPA